MIFNATHAINIADALLSLIDPLVAKLPFSFCLKILGVQMPVLSRCMFFHQVTFCFNGKMKKVFSPVSF